MDSTQLLGQLPELLEMLQDTCLQLNDAITTKFFRHEEAVLWSSEGGL